MVRQLPGALLDGEVEEVVEAGQLLHHRLTPAPINAAVERTGRHAHAHLEEAQVLGLEVEVFAGGHEAVEDGFRVAGQGLPRLLHIVSIAAGLEGGEEGARWVDEAVGQQAVEPAAGCRRYLFPRV